MTQTAIYDNNNQISHSATPAIENKIDVKLLVVVYIDV